MPSIAEPEIEIEALVDEGDPDLDAPWNVVLLDDDHHTYDYVIIMLMEIFGYDLQKSYKMTVEVDTKKRVIVWTGHRELAEMKQEQIHEYGPDWRMKSSKGPMSAILERAR